MNDEGVCCTICEERYSEQRIPRSLSCGHTFCTTCLSQLEAGNSRQCPECRTPFPEESVATFSINYSLLRLARAQVLAMPSPASSAGREPNAGECPSHGSLMFFRCVKCEVWVCRDCLVLDHREAPRGSCVIKTIKQATKDMVDSDTKKHKDLIAKVTRHLNDNSKQQFQLQKTKSEHEAKIASLRQSIEAEQKEVELLDSREEELKKKASEMTSWISDVEKAMGQTVAAATPSETSSCILVAAQVRENVEERMKNLIIDTRPEFPSGRSVRSKYHWISRELDVVCAASRHQVPGSRHLRSTEYTHHVPADLWSTDY